MDFETVIETIIDLGSKRDKLSSLITSEEKGIHYATVEGELAFSDGDYHMESGYIQSVTDHKKNAKQYSSDLAQLSEKIKEVYQQFETNLSAMSKGMLEDALTVLFEKKFNEEMEIKTMSDSREKICSEAQKAFKDRDYNQEKKYNELADELYKKIDNAQLRLNQYPYLESRIQGKINSYNGPIR